MAKFVIQLLCVFVATAVIATSFAAPQQDQPMCRCEDIQDDPNFRKCTCETRNFNRDYYKSINSANLVGAKTDCTSRNRTVVRVQDEEELITIRDMLARDGDSANLFWTDAYYDNDQKKFLWQGSQQTPVDPSWWEPGFPGSESSNLDGVLLVYRSAYKLPQFRVVQDSTNARYICEVERECDI